MSRLGIIVGMMMAMALLLSGELLAQSPPTTIQFQATLSNANGLLEGRKRVVVSLRSGVTANWTETHKNVDFVGGVANLILGSITPLRHDQFLIVSPNFHLVIEGEQTTIPLHAVPYAMHAKLAETVNPTLNIGQLAVTTSLTIGLPTSDMQLDVSGNARVRRVLHVNETAFINRLSIATTNVTYNLNVGGTLNAQAIYINGSPLQTNITNPKLLALAALPTANNLFLLANGSNWATANAVTVKALLGLAGPNITPTFSALAIGTNTPSAAFQVGTDALFVTQNWVGIGTSTPRNPLQVSANTLVASNNVVMIGTTVPQAGNVLTVSGNLFVAGTIQSNNGGGTSLWSQNGSTRLYVQNKNVGIGGTTPSGDFEVFTQSAYNAPSSSPFLSTFMVDNYRVAIGHDAPRAYLDIAPNYPVAASPVNVDPYIWVRDPNVSNTAHFIVKSGSGTNGRVGLGTFTPAGQLNIVKNGYESLYVNGSRIGIGRTDPEFNFQLTSANANMALDAQSGGQSALLLRQAGTRTWELRKKSDNHLYVMQDGIERMTFLAGGFIGIGTTTPGSILHVRDNNIDALTIQSGRVGVGTSSTAGQFHVRSNPTDNIVVTSNLVGIGTSLPTALLTVRQLAATQHPLRITDFAGTRTYLSLGPTGSMGIGRLPSNETLSVSGNQYISRSLGVSGNTYLTADLWVGGRVQSTADITLLPGTGKHVLLPLATATYLNVSSGDVVIGNPSLLHDTTTGSDLFVEGNLILEGAFVQSATSSSIRVGSLTVSKNAILGYAPGSGLSVGTRNATARLSVVASSDVSARAFDVRNNTGQSLLILENNGRLGLGIDPSATLDVNGITYIRNIVNAERISITQNAILAASGGHRVGIATTQPSATLHLAPTSNLASDLAFWIGNSNRELFRIQNDGLIGIGRSAPAAQLHVSGSVPLRVDTPTVANLFLVSSNSRIGIGTSATRETLTVSGTGFFTGHAFVSGNQHVDGMFYLNNGNIAANTAMTLTPSTGSSLNIMLAGSGDVWIPTGDIVLGPTSNRRATTTGSDLFVAGNLVLGGLLYGNGVTGNHFDAITVRDTALMATANTSRVGIGTETPAAKVQIVGTSNNSSDFSVLATNAAGRPLFAARNDDRVGIGTASPRETLAVSGSALVSGNLYVSGNTVFNGGLTMSAVQPPSGTNFVMTMAGGSLTQLSGGDLVIGPTSIVKNGSANPDLFVQGNLVVDGQVFQSMGASSVFESIAVTANAFLATQNVSNVGIGTVWPQAKLEVTGNNKVLFTAGTPSTQNAMMIDSHGRVGINVPDTAVIDRAFFVSGNAKVSGNMDISGVMTLSKLAGSGQPILALQTAGSNRFSLGVDQADANKFKIGTTALGTNTRFTIDGTGQVGVGTSAPDSQFHVVSGTSVSPLRIQSATTANMLIVDQHGRVGINTHTANVIDRALWVSGNTMVSGNLNVSNNIYVQGNMAVVGTIAGNFVQQTVALNQSSGNDPFVRYNINGTNHFTTGVDASDGNKFKIGTTAVETNPRLTIDSNGAIGIGTTTPLARLEVTANSGTILAVGTPTLANALAVDSSGRVGINTHSLSTLDRALWVSGNAMVSGNLNVADNLFVNGNIQGNFVQAAIELLQNAGLDAFIRYRIGGPIHFTSGVDATDNFYKIGTAALEINTRLAIDSTGRVGLGTALPQAQLEVSANNGTMLSVGKPTFPNALAVDSNGHVGINTHQLGTIDRALWVSGNTMVSGNLNVSHNLHVQGTIVGNFVQNSATLNQVSGHDPTLYYGVNGTYYFTTGVDVSDANKFKIGTSAVGTSPRLTIDSAGRIGVGTTSPLAQLDVSANGATVFRTGTAATANAFVVNQHGQIGLNVAAATELDRVLVVSGNMRITGNIEATATLDTKGGIVIHHDSNKDPRTIYAINGTQLWMMGIDGDDGTSFKLGRGDFETTANARLRIGINTTDPVTARGTGSEIFTVQNLGNSNRNVVNIGADGAHDGHLGVYKADGTTIGINLLASGNSYIRGGYLGVGTTQPLAQMEVSANGATLLAVGTVTSANALVVNQHGHVGINMTHGLAAMDHHVLFVSGDTKVSGNLDASKNIYVKDSVYVSGNLTVGGTFTGNLGFQTLYLNQGAGSDPFVRFAINGSDHFTAGVDADNDNKFKIGTTAIDANTRFVIDGNGRVGIGTVTPSAQLEVTANGATVFTAGTPTTANALLVNQNGYVGINIRNPMDLDRAFTVSGNLWVTGNVETTSTLNIKEGLVISHASGKDPKLSYVVNGTDYWTVGVDGDDATNFKISRGDLGSNTDARFQIGINGTDPVMARGSGSSIFLAQNVNNSNRTVVNVGADGSNHGMLSVYKSDGTSIGVNLVGTGNSYFNGTSLGVGTTLPLAQLEVTANGTTVFTAGTPASANALVVNQHGRVGINLTHGLTAMDHHVLFVSGDTKVSGNLAVSDNLYVQDNLNVSGNLSVDGTISGTVAFTVVDINTGAGNDAFVRYGSNGVDYITMGIDVSDANKFKIGTTEVSTGTRLTLDSNGQIGIATTQPGGTLHVVGHNSTAAPFIVGTNSTPNVVYVNASGFVGINAHGSPGLIDRALWVSGDAKVSGNMHVSANLHVSQNLYVRDNVVISKKAGTAPISDPLLTFSTAGSDRFILGVDQSAGNRFQIGKSSFGNVVFSIDDEGRVGLDQPNPLAHLHVNGGSIGQLSSTNILLGNDASSTAMGMSFLPTQNKLTFYTINQGTGEEKASDILTIYDAATNAPGFVSLGGATSPNIPGMSLIVSGNAFVSENLVVSENVIVSGDIVLSGKMSMLPTGNSNLANGDFWYDGTRLKFRTGGSTTDIVFEGPDTPLYIAGAYQYSDRNLKKNINPLNNALDRVRELTGVTYLWREDAIQDRFTPMGLQIGLIAQDVEKIFPEVVMTDKQGVKSVAYANLVPILVEAIKEQQRDFIRQRGILDDQAAKIEALGNTQQRLMEEIEALRKDLEELRDD